jgi:hypothetical protein
MKRMAELMLAAKKIAPRFATTASLLIAASIFAVAQSSAQTQLPEVHLDAAGLAPRPIEELTGTTMARHYALAWHDLAVALESGRATGLGDEFVGFAKDRLTRRIAEQNQAGVHVRIVDRGHHLKAIFYSTDGAAMQLRDQVELEIQIFDGDKLIDTQNAPREYMVLMTPGADRWYVRDLEEVSAKSF